MTSKHVVVLSLRGEQNAKSANSLFMHSNYYCCKCCYYYYCCCCYFFYGYYYNYDCTLLTV